jgi:glycosyltransferase involved in cell wall biosynthesis
MRRPPDDGGDPLPPRSASPEEDGEDHALSIVIPFYDEEESVASLLDELHVAMEDSPWPWEVVLVDDGSTDGTLERLHEARRRHGDHVSVVALRRNFGQTAATQAGIDAASGSLVATLDGDGQNDPDDVLRLAHRLLAEELDLVVGWRRTRRDGFLLRRFPSFLANRLIGGVTGVRLHDYGCSLKVYRASVMEAVKLYGEMHRFIPAWLAAHTAPERIAEEVVNHRPREAGRSKYGVGRTLRVLLDLLSVHFFMRYWTRPGHFFGSLGIGLGGVGGAILAYLFWVKFGLGQDIGTRPLLLVGVVLVIASLQFITTGVVAELLTRVYFESPRVKPYVVRHRTGGGEKA